MNSTEGYIYHILMCGRHDNDVVDHGRSCFDDDPIDHLTSPQMLKNNNDYSGGRRVLIIDER